MSLHLAPYCGALSCALGLVAIAPASSAVENATGRSETAARTVTIVESTYGQNCGARRGNLTLDAARRCNGLQTCGYMLPPHSGGDGRQACRRNFIAEWRCGRDESHVAALGAGAAPGDELVMSCARFGGAGK